MNNLQLIFLVFYLFISHESLQGQSIDCPENTVWGQASTDPILAHYANSNLGETYILYTESNKTIQSIKIFAAFFNPFFEEGIPENQMPITVDFSINENNQIGEKKYSITNVVEMVPTGQKVGLNNPLENYKIYTATIPLDTMINTHNLWIQIRNHSLEYMMFLTSSGGSARTGKRPLGGNWEYKDSEIRPDICLLEPISFTYKSEYSQLELYPNPSNDRVHIDLKESIIHEIYLMDVTGKVLKTYKSTDHQNILNLEGLLPGIYLITVKTNNANICKKLIIDSN